jgi:hypothetical protein
MKVQIICDGVICDGVIYDRVIGILEKNNYYKVQFTLDL